MLPIHRVLVVEDEPDHLAVLVPLLERRFRQVLVAASGDAARGLFAAHRPELVLLDLILPDESGFEVCRSIKRASLGAFVTIVSGIDSPAARRLASRVGADLFVPKPFDPADLVRQIEAARKSTAEPAPESADSAITFRCHCGQRLKAKRKHFGRRVVCLRCGSPVTIGAAVTTASAVLPGEPS